MNRKRVITLVLALCFTLQTCLVTAFASVTREKPYYDDFVIFGDSICLGFSTADASMAVTETYNIERNAVEALYPHAYPTVFGDMIGLDTDFKDDGNVDVYNFGVCAAWSKDIYELLSNPYYIYMYYSNNFDKDTLYSLPEEYKGIRYIVDTDAENYDVGDFDTWKYERDEEGNYLGTEEYTIPAGYKIHVGYEMNLWGSTYLMVSPVIQEKYYYVSSQCLDENGLFLDTNDDGKVDDSDIIYYPTKASEYSYVPDESEENIAKYGEAIRNPQFTKYYYNYMTDRVKNGDLIALAAGGNDIYHSFMPYQRNSGTTLGNLVYWITYALQMNYSIGDIISMLESDYWQDVIFGDSVNTTSNTSPDTTNNTDGDGNSNQNSGISGLLSQEELIKLLDYYSKENISEYLEDVVEDYKIYYEKSIQRILELKQDKSELVLVGHFNPFGMENYLTMLAENLKSGVLLEDISKDGQSLVALLKAIIGDGADYESIQNMSDDQRAEAVAQSYIDISKLLDILKNNPNLSDEELTKLFVDLSYPLAVLIMGDGLSGVYEELNSFVADMAEKYDIAYVDVSGAPTSGRYDPHPTEAGHKWIANKLYKTVVPSITASISCVGTGKGTITSKGTTNFRLRDSKEYSIVPADGSKISAIFIDGKLLDPKDYKDVYSSGSYVFENILESHYITVQFDIDCDWSKKYTVDVIGSYSEDGGGEGLYEAGSTATIKAGTLEGYEFAGWITDGIELADANAETTTFEVPAKDITIVASWTPVTEETEPQSYTLSFNTFGGNSFSDISKEEGTELSLDGYIPEKEGFNFSGWYSDKEFTNRIDSVTFNENKIIYAKWESTLSFDTNGGSKVTSVTKDEGTVLLLDEYKPTKKGFAFEGWYSDKELTSKVDSVTFNENTTVYAKWKAIENNAIPHTGDESNIGIWSSLAVISGVGILATIIYIKKRRFI